MSVSKKTIEEIGVEGCLPRRLLDLMLSLGFELRAVRDVDHPSRVSLVFWCDANRCYTTITYEDTMELPTDKIVKERTE